MFHVKHDPFRTQLEAVLGHAGISLSERQLGLLTDHWKLVKEWSTRTNLTAIHDDRAAASLHYRDSLEALRVLPEGSVLDIGSGPGFPGIPLAIARPEQAFVLMEPRRKRASLLRVAVARLQLANVRVMEARIDDPPDAAYGAAVTRATFSSGEELQACGKWLLDGKKLFAFRKIGSSSHQEVHTYDVDGDSRVIEIWTFSRGFTN